MIGKINVADQILDFNDFFARTDTLKSFKEAFDWDEDDDDEGAFASKLGGNIEKPPILFDDEDWKFLIQFPPKFWKKALEWRYNEGMLAASEAREKNNLDDAHLPDWVDNIVFNVRNGTTITIKPLPNQKQLYVGFQKLFKKLEAPVKVSKPKPDTDDEEQDYDYCNDPNEDKTVKAAKQTPEIEGPGIDQVMVFPNHTDATRDMQLQPRDTYKGGFYDFDLTKPNRIDDDMIDLISSSEAEAKKKKKQPPHHMAGMTVIKHQVASDVLNAWIRGSAYIDNGENVEAPLLGVSTQTTKDPETGRDVEAVFDPYRGKFVPTHRKKPSQSFLRWADELGQEDVKDEDDDDDDDDSEDGDEDTAPPSVTGKPHGLELPVIYKKVNYSIRTKNEPEESFTEVLPMPVLGSGRVLPNLKGSPEASLSDAQRDALVKRIQGGYYKNNINLKQELEMLRQREAGSQSHPLGQEEAQTLKKAEAELKKIDKEIIELRRHPSMYDANTPELEDKREEIENKLGELFMKKHDAQQKAAQFLSRKPLTKKDKERILAIQKKVSKNEIDAEKPNKDWRSIGRIKNLFRHYDLLTPAQRKHLRENQRDAYHITAAANDPEYKHKWADKFRGVNRRFVLGGFSPNYQQRRAGKAVPTNPDVIRQIIEQYMPYGAPGLPRGAYDYGGLMGEAKSGIERYMTNMLGWQKKGEDEDIPPHLERVKSRGARKRKENAQEDFTAEQRETVLSVLQKHKADMVSCCAALLVLNLNNPLMGIFAPKLCLNRARPGADAAKQTKMRRINYAYDFAWAISQAALDETVGSRRQRERAKRYGSQVAGRAAMEDKARGGSSGPQLSEFGGHIDNMRVWYKTVHSEVARSQWLIKGVGPLAAFFNGINQQIAAKLGASMAEPGRKLETALLNATNVANAIYNQAMEDLTNQGMKADDPRKEALAQKAVDEKLKNWLMKHRPAQFGKMSDEDWATMMSDMRKKGFTSIPTVWEGTPDEPAEWVGDLFQGLAEDGYGVLVDENNVEHPISVGMPELASLTDIESVVKVVAQMAVRAKIELNKQEIANAQDEKREPHEFEWLTPANIVQKYGVDIVGQVLQHNNVPKSRDEIISWMTKNGYPPLQGKYDAPAPKEKPAAPPAEEKPATTGLPAAITKPQEPTSAPGKMAANPLAALLADPTGKLDDILNHPEAVKYKPHIKARLAVMLKDFADKRAAAEAAGQKFRLTPKEIITIGRLNHFVNS